MTLKFGSYAFLLVCVYETSMVVNGLGFARSRRIFDSSFTPRFQEPVRTSTWRRSNFGLGRSSAESTFTPRFQEALRTSSWRRSNFGLGGSSVESSFTPRFQEASRTSSSRRSLLGPGGSSSVSPMQTSLSFGRRNDRFRPEISVGTNNFSPMHFNRRRPSVFNNNDRDAIIENVRHQQKGTSSREVIERSIQLTQPDNTVRRSSILFQENRPSTNIASILQRLRSRTSDKSSKENTKSSMNQINQHSRHNTVSFLENRRPKQDVTLSLAKIVKNSKEVKDSSLKPVNHERTFRHPIVSFLDKRRPPSQANYVPVKTELKEQKVGKTSKEKKEQYINDREAKMKKIRQLLQLMPGNQRYKFLVGLKTTAGFQTSAEQPNLRKTKMEYPKVPLRSKLSQNPKVTRKSAPLEITRHKKNKKKTSAEKKSPSNHYTQENTDESFQRILLLRKLNTFLRQQLNHNPKQQKSEPTKDSSKGKIKTSKEVTSNSNKHGRTHHTHHVHHTRQLLPQSRTAQTQYEMPRISLESTRLTPHRRRLELLARLNSHGLGTSPNFGELLTKAVNSKVNPVNTAKQSKLSNINPYSSQSLKLLDQKDVLNTSKEKKSEEKFTWENP